MEKIEKYNFQIRGAPCPRLIQKLLDTINWYINDSLWWTIGQVDPRQEPFGANHRASKHRNQKLRCRKTVIDPIQRIGRYHPRDLVWVWQNPEKFCHGEYITLGGIQVGEARENLTPFPFSVQYLAGPIAVDWKFEWMGASALVDQPQEARKDTRPAVEGMETELADVIAHGEKCWEAMKRGTFKQ